MAEMKAVMRVACSEEKKDDLTVDEMDVSKAHSKVDMWVGS